MYFDILGEEAYDCLQFVIGFLKCLVQDYFFLNTKVMVPPTTPSSLEVPGSEVPPESPKYFISPVEPGIYVMNPSNLNDDNLQVT